MEIFLVGSVILNIVLGFALVVTKTKLKEKKEEYYNLMLMQDMVKELAGKNERK